MEKTRIRQHFENVMLNSRLMKQITVAMECLATVTASVVSERYERLSFQNARFLLFMSMDALNFHVQPSTPFNSIYLALIFGASSKWIRLLNDRMEKRERERENTATLVTHAPHTTCNFRLQIADWHEPKCIVTLRTRNLFVLLHYTENNWLVFGRTMVLVRRSQHREIDKEITFINMSISILFRYEIDSLKCNSDTYTEEGASPAASADLGVGFSSVDIRGRGIYFSHLL